MKAEFGPFLLDLGRRQVLEGKDVVAMSPKAFDLLALLVARWPNAVGKEAILAAIWEDTSPSDASLTNAIAELRRALRDSPDRPQYIRTAHRFGYAFCANVRFQDQDGSGAGRAFWFVVEGRQVFIAEGQAIVGRMPTASIHIAREQVSWQHAQITRRGESVTVEDLDSTNGTFVQGQRICETAVIRIGDEVRFADVCLVLEGTSRERRRPTKRIAPI